MKIFRKFFFLLRTTIFFFFLSRHIHFVKCVLRHFFHHCASYIYFVNKIQTDPHIASRVYTKITCWLIQALIQVEFSMHEIMRAYIHFGICTVHHLIFTYFGAYWRNSKKHISLDVWFFSRFITTKNSHSQTRHCSSMIASNDWNRVWERERQWENDETKNKYTFIHNE